MKVKTREQVQAAFERYCDNCLRMAIDEYLYRATHSELREVQAFVELHLAGPCKTEDCQEECNEKGAKDEKATV